MNPSTPFRRGLRRVGAISAGLFGVIAVSTLTDMAMHAAGIFPPLGQPMSDALFVLATSYRLVYGVWGGYVAARLAPDRPKAHAWALGAVGVALGSLGAAATWDAGPAFGPRWYPLLLIATALPTAWLGGKMFVRRAHERPAKEAAPPPTA